MTPCLLSNAAERMGRTIKGVSLRPYGKTGFEKYWVDCAPALQPELTPTGKVRKNRRPLEDGFWLTRSGSITKRIESDFALDDFRASVAAKRVLELVDAGVRDRDSILESAKAAPEEIRKRSGAIGSDVHKAIAHFLGLRDDEDGRRLPTAEPGRWPFWVPNNASEEVLYAINLFADWWAQAGLKICALEETVWSLNLGYAGTFDMLCQDELVSLKTSKDLHASYLLQEVSYAYAMREMGYERLPSKGLIVHLPKDMKSPVKLAWCWQSLAELEPLLQLWEDLVVILDRLPGTIRSIEHPSGTIHEHPPTTEDDETVEPGVSCSSCGRLHTSIILNRPLSMEADYIKQFEDRLHQESERAARSEQRVAQLERDLVAGKSGSACSECGHNRALLGNAEEQLRAAHAQLSKTRQAIGIQWPEECEDCIKVAPESRVVERMRKAAEDTGRLVADLTAKVDEAEERGRLALEILAAWCQAIDDDSCEPSADVEIIQNRTRDFLKRVRS